MTTIAPIVPTKAEDCARYQELTSAMALDISSDSADSAKFQKLWEEREQIKNRNGGNPPKL